MGEEGGGGQATSAWKPQTLGQAQVRQAALATLSGWLSYQLMAAAGTAVGEGREDRLAGGKGSWRQVIKPSAGALPRGHQTPCTWGPFSGHLGST